MTDRIYERTGRTLPMGDGYRSVEGFTTIDTPTDENLYCEFKINDEGDVTLEFRDSKTARIAADMLLEGAFSGFTLGWKPADRKRLT